MAKHLDALILPDGTISKEAVAALGLSLGEEEEGGGRVEKRRPEKEATPAQEGDE